MKLFPVYASKSLLDQSSASDFILFAGDFFDLLKFLDFSLIKLKKKNPKNKRF